MKHFDLFSGIGGFSLALREVYPDAETIGYSEIDKYAIQIYEKHFPGIKNYGDIRLIQERELPDFDLVTFGFPCQDLSIAGKRKGLVGERSSLFHEAIRIINFKRPKYFIFENVAGLFSSHEGKDFVEILQTITDIGYNGQWQLINTKWFLPQNRERIFFVGHLREESRPEIFPIGENGCEPYGTPEETQGDGTRLRVANSLGIGGGMKERNLIANTLTQRDYKDMNQNLLQINNPKHSNERIYDADGISPALNTMQGGLRQPFIRIKDDNRSD